jgi:magnesium-protoporphyrin IX monomethyl ester (oxidative) cyclase
MFNHVLCVYPYRRELNHSGFCPPLGLEFIAAVLHPHARTLDLVDLRKEAGSTKDFLRPETDMVCFSINWDRDPESLHEEILSVSPGIFTLLGGRYATENPDHWLTAYPNVTAVVRGDGEEATEEICRGMPLAKVAGLSYRKNGQIFHNPNRKVGPVRNDLFPKRHMRRYVYEATLDGIDTGLSVDTLAASRGCPFNCAFCSFSRNPWGEKRPWSARSPESVVEELSQIEAGIVGFTDDLFTFDMDRVEQICELILARGIRKKYIINARLEIARRPDIIRKMERAGFTMLLLGIESAQDKTLRAMRKGFDTAEIREHFKVLRHSRMFLHGYFILGNIGESMEEMFYISAFARELGLDTLGLSTLRFNPHSGLEELIARHPDYHIAPDGNIYSNHCSKHGLKQLRRRILREFHTPGQLFHLIHKGLQNGALSLLPALLPRLPAIVWRMGHRVVKHAKRREHRQTHRLK